VNVAVSYEKGPVTRYMNAETENEHLKMLLLNLTTASCPYARLSSASDALVEAHRESSATLDRNCANCVFHSYLSGESKR
jgi:hypothetical protein